MAAKKESAMADCLSTNTDSMQNIPTIEVPVFGDGNSKTTTNDADNQKIVYGPTDSSPYKVQFRLKDENNEINVFSLGRDLRKAGFFYDIFKTEKQTRLSALVYCNKLTVANRLIKDMILAAKYDVAIPERLVFSTGIISGMPRDIPDLEILEDLKRMHPNVTEVKRMTRKDEKGQFVPIMRVMVKFRSNRLPEYVFLFYTVVKVKAYINKVRFCTNCLKYNHIATKCRSSKRCRNCTKENCEGCDTGVICISCGGAHPSGDRKCPKFTEQEMINHLMAVNNLTFQEAKRKMPATSANQFDILRLDDFPAIQRRQTSNDNLETFAEKVKEFVREPTMKKPENKTPTNKKAKRENRFKKNKSLPEETLSDEEFEKMLEEYNRENTESDKSNATNDEVIRIEPEIITRKSKRGAEPITTTTDQSKKLKNQGFADLKLYKKNMKKQITQEKNRLMEGEITEEDYNVFRTNHLKSYEEMKKKLGQLSDPDSSSHE